MHSRDDPVFSAHYYNGLKRYENNFDYLKSIYQINNKKCGPERASIPMDYIPRIISPLKALLAHGQYILPFLFGYLPSNLIENYSYKASGEIVIYRSPVAHFGYLMRKGPQLNRE